MKIRVLHDAPTAIATPLLVVGVPRQPTDGGTSSDPDPEGGSSRGLPPAARVVDAWLGGRISRALEAGEFEGREEDALLLYAPLPAGDDSDTRPDRVLVLGLGDPARVSPATLRGMAARAVRRAEALRVTELHLVVPAARVPTPRRTVTGQGSSEPSPGAEGAEAMVRGVQAAAEGLVLAAWDFRELRSGPAPDARPPHPLVTEASIALDLEEGEGGPEDDTLAAAIRTGHALGTGENFARTLQQRPGNVATPTHLAATALQLAEEHGFEATILGPREMEREEMHLLLSVSAGSDQEPRLIALEHRGGKEGDAPLVLVGKGLTFDAGGISIKPASGMEDMKFDMSGGAAVLGAMKAIGMLGLPVNVVGVVPASENLLNGRANKPGDVVRGRSGTTVEIINTDAEGRLILADALHWAAETFRPRAMVDCATLTGACVIALGHQASAVLGTDEALVEALRAAGDHADEPCWPLPLWDAYRSQLDSPVADLKNVGGRPAGTVTAALFLRAFTGDTPWAHLDIAGAAYGDPLRPWHRKGGFGAPTRLLLEWVRSATA